MLYPHLRLEDVTFHQDHIHPAARFEESNFVAMGIPKEQWKDWIELRDCLPNLQLMEGRQNSTKNATPLKNWLDGMSESHQSSFSKTNFLPNGVDLEFVNFISFYQERKEVLREELRKFLSVTKTTIPDEMIWTSRDEENSEE